MSGWLKTLTFIALCYIVIYGTGCSPYARFNTAYLPQAQAFCSKIGPRTLAAWDVGWVKCVTVAPDASQVYTDIPQEISSPWMTQPQ